MSRGRNIVILLCALLPTVAQGKLQTEFGDSTKTHVFTLGGELLTRGEYRKGSLANPGTTYAAFFYERTRLSLNYKQQYLEIQLTPQHAGVWGTTNGGTFTLREAWAQTDYKGFFAKLGRQSLTYDDERVVGLDDWSMTGAYHDALKIGYEGFGHKLHLLGAYCQTDDNTDGGTIYIGGVQVYKNMEMLWYHYDFKRWFSGSLLFMNTGTQSALDSKPDTTFYQQMVGTYWRFLYTGNDLPKDDAPWWVDIDASCYFQFGRTEINLPLSTWMVAVEARAKANQWIRFNTGYFHLSGDEDYIVPPPGWEGLQHLKHDHSFNLLYGSKHQFYGAMEFFYLESFFGGYSPGLQDGHFGITFTYDKLFDFQTQYHLLATSMRVHKSPTLILGHELELIANYRPLDWMTISAGYSFMQGTKTMEMVKRTTERNQCHWAYLMVTINPTFVKVRF